MAFFFSSGRYKNVYRYFNTKENYTAQNGQKVLQKLFHGLSVKPTWKVIKSSKLETKYRMQAIAIEKVLTQNFRKS